MITDKKSRDDGTPVLTAPSPDPRRRVVRMIENALYYLEGGRRAESYQSITKKPLTPIEPARTARIRA